MSARAYRRTGAWAEPVDMAAHLAHDAADWTNQRRATRHAEGRLDPLQAQCLAQVQRGEQGTVGLVLVGHIGAEYDLHHAAFVVDCEAVDTPLQRMHPPLDRDDGLMNLRGACSA